MSRAARARIKGLGDGRTRVPKPNSALDAKVELRRWLLNEMAALGVVAPRILDCFCGGGQMWARAYDKPGHDRYLGIDLDLYQDERRTIVADSARFLRDVDVDLRAWDLFDLDAFGTPMEHLAVICRRLGETTVDVGRIFGFVLTDGTGFASRMANQQRGLIAYVGVERHAGSSFQQEHRVQIEQMAVARALQEGRFALLSRRVLANKGRRPSAEMRYIALTVQRVA